MPPKAETEEAIEDTDLYALMIRAQGTPDLAKEIVTVLKADCKFDPMADSFFAYFKHQDLFVVYGSRPP